MAIVHRLDFARGRLRADLKTAQLGAKVPARLSRTGVQNYVTADGKTLREFRPAAEVFHPASIASFSTATVTIGHPDMVDPSNWKKYAIGHVLDAKPEDGRYVAADLVLQDADALRRANLPADDPDALVEVSCGYTCDLQMTPGTSPEGESYDAIQTSLVINHVALGPKSWGRAGPAVRLQLDAAICVDGVCSPGCPCSDCGPTFDRSQAISELITTHHIWDVALGEQRDAYLAERLRLCRMSDEALAAHFRNLLDTPN